MKEEVKLADDLVRRFREIGMPTMHKGRWWSKKRKAAFLSGESVLRVVSPVGSPDYIFALLINPKTGEFL